VRFPRIKWYSHVTSPDDTRHQGPRPRSVRTHYHFSRIFRQAYVCAMIKRDADEAGLDAHFQVKRVRANSRDHFSRLSDELILRVVSYLPVQDLATAHRYAGSAHSRPHNANPTDSRTSTMLSLATINYGRHITTIASCDHERAAYLESRIWVEASRRQTSQRKPRDGSMKSVLSREEGRRDGSSSTNFGTTGQGAVRL